MVALTLGELGDTRAVEPLLTILHDPDPRVREITVWGLSELGATQAVEPLMSMLFEETVRSLRTVTAWGTG